MSQTKAQLLEGNSSQSLSLSSAVVAVGSAGSPSVTFTGDTNTGIYSPGADQVAISTSGTGRLFITSAGNIGVGVSPTTAEIGKVVLDVSGPLLARGAVSGNQTSAGVFQHSSDITAIRSYGATANSGVITFSTGGGGSADTERMRLDSSGRLGLGTSTPGSILTAKGPIASTSDWGNLGITSEFAINSANRIYNGLYFLDSGTSGSAGIGFSYDGTGYKLHIGTASSISSGISTALTVDRSQRVGIGTTTPNAPLSFGTATGTAGTANKIRIYDSAPNIYGFGVSANQLDYISDGSHVFYGSNNGGSPFERARLTSDGKFLVGTSTASGNAVIQTNVGDISARFASNTIFDYPIVQIKSGRAGSGFAATLVDFRRDTEVTIGSITANASAVAYNTSSDYRLKENVVPLTGAVDRVNQLQVHRFNFIEDPDRTVDGFIAHEAQAVVPECVTGEKDAVDDDGNPVYQGIDQSKLVPLLTAALQETIAELQDLKAEVAALKAS